MIWSVSRATRQAPSELLGIREWAAETLTDTGRANGWLDPDTVFPDDWWTPLQFDAAVSFFGTWIEGKLNQYDDKGKPIYDLVQLLDDEPGQGADKAIDALKMTFGVRKGGWGENGR